MEKIYELESPIFLCISGAPILILPTIHTMTCKKISARTISYLELYFRKFMIDHTIDYAI